MTNIKNVFDVPAAKEHPLIEQFKAVKVTHGHFDHCFSEVRRLCSRSGTSGVVILTGPTGSGKTHLARELFRSLRLAFNDVPAENRDEAYLERDALVPVAGIRAVPPRATAFDWQDFYIRLLEQLRDILVEKKLLVPVQLSLLGEFPVTSPAESMKVQALRRSVEKALRLRKTRVVVVDEAHHILMCKDPDMQRFAFEQLKSLTDETGIVLVLVGTYDLLDIRDYSGQLMRRSDIVHLQRYDYKDEKHRTSFLHAFNELVKALPIPVVIPNRADAIDLCYRKSAGCVGILRDLLLECLRRAVEEGGNAIDLELIQASAKSNQAVWTILKEAMEGESRLIDIDDNEIRALLLQTGTESARAGQHRTPPTSVKQRPGQRRPGTRNPHRDDVGGE